MRLLGQFDRRITQFQSSYYYFYFVQVFYKEKPRFFRAGLPTTRGAIKLLLNRTFRVDQTSRMNNAHETCNVRYQYQSRRP
jgi:hypothetical protein